MDRHPENSSDNGAPITGCIEMADMVKEDGQDSYASDTIKLPDMSEIDSSQWAPVDLERFFSGNTCHKRF